MDLTAFEAWLKTYYQTRAWYDLDVFIRMGFLTEEVGELAQAIRSMEIGRDRPDEVAPSQAQKKQAVCEEIGDVLANLVLLAQKYDLSLAEVCAAHQQKLIQRYQPE
ncbi:MAG: MazG-like family protein [Neisseriaceae bacterium]|nr:MazG-like family protein [Neisseriaceae bacterium]MBP6860867.1 MazG-like family protein [Neisseriaceae bacterium]